MIVAIHLLIGYLFLGAFITMFYAMHYGDVKRSFERAAASRRDYPDNDYYEKNYRESAKELQDTWFRLITMFVAWLPYVCQYILWVLQKELETVNRAASALKDEDNG